MQNKQPRAHHDIIVAWANGEQIQYRKDAGMYWTDCADPAFVEDYQYRVKPERESLETKMTNAELSVAAINAMQASSPFADHKAVLYRGIANAAIRHALDAGQVVTREEFDRAIGARDARDLAIAKGVRDSFLRLINCETIEERRQVLNSSSTLMDIIAKVKP